MAYIPKRSYNDSLPKGRRGTFRQFYGPAQRGYDARWREVRAYYIQAHPLCEMCEEAGRLTPAQMVHHRKPIADGGDVYDEDNLEALCWRCHSIRHHKL